MAKEIYYIVKTIYILITGSKNNFEVLKKFNKVFVKKNRLET